MTSKMRYRSSWLILLVVLLVSIAAPLNQFKVPPVMSILMHAFSLSAGKAGLLMSIFAVTGLILALPAGFIFQSLGFRVTGFIAILAIMVGALMGALSPGIGTMFTSRFIEGIGMSFMAVVAPAVIAMRFTAEKRGKAMGIWSIWVPLGSLVMFSAAPSLAARWDWQGVWWFGFSYGLFVAVLFYLFVKPVPSDIGGKQDATGAGTLSGRDLMSALKNRDLWMISLLFACFNFIFVSFMTWYPAFLHGVRNLSLGGASLLMSTMTAFLLFSGPLGGWLSDRMGSRKLVCVVPMLLTIVLLPIASVLNAGMLLPLMMLIGLIGGFVPTGVYSAGPEVVGDHRLHGMAMAVIQVGQNTGMLLGPFVFGWVVDLAGWQAAFWTLAPVSALGALTAWRAKLR